MFKKTFSTVESRFFEPVRKMDKKMRNRKWNVVSNHSFKIKCHVD